MLFAAPAASCLPDEKAKLSTISKRLRDVYTRYACFGHTDPHFRSKEFVKVVRESELMTPAFNIAPPNRVDFVFTYACVHGPGGYRGNKTMSLDAFAYATRGIAHETGKPHEEVLAALEGSEPQLHPTAEPSAPVSSHVVNHPAARAAGEDEWLREAQHVSPLVRGGALRSYSSHMTKRDAEQMAYSLACHKGPPSRLVMCEL